MSEEEKKAIKNLQEVAQHGIDIYEEINVMENEDAIRIVLNLINRQQKEIEQLKMIATAEYFKQFFENFCKEEINRFYEKIEELKNKKITKKEIMQIAKKYIEDKTIDIHGFYTEIMKLIEDKEW